MARKTPEQYRKSELAKIHIAKKALALDDDTYRDILQNVCKVDSSAKLDSQGRFKLLKHFESLGWKNSRPKWGRKPRVNGNKTALMGKLEALLADSGLPWKYADAMAKHMFKVDQVAWLDAAKLHKVVAALQIQANRKKNVGAGLVPARNEKNVGAGLVPARNRSKVTTRDNPTAKNHE